MARKFPSWVVKAENPRYSAAEYLIFFVPGERWERREIRAKLPKRRGMGDCRGRPLTAINSITVGKPASTSGWGGKGHFAG
jgi:hypothetical protein